MSKQANKGLVPALRFPEFREAGEWEEKILGSSIEEFREKSTVQDEFEVLTSARGGLVRQREYYDNDRITERDNIGFNIVPPNYLTYRSRSDDRRFYFNENNLGITGIISTYYPVFRVPEGSNKFFVALLARYSTIVGKHSVGTSQTVLSLNELRRIRLPIPKKEEQQKIADCLTSIDELVTAQTQKLDALKTHKKGLMQQLFPADGETVPKLRFPEFGDKGGWEEKPLEKVAIFSKGKGVSKSDISPNGKQPCIRYGELYTHYNETIKTVISFTDVPVDELVLSEANDVIIPASGETEEDIATASCVLNSGIALGGDLNIIRSNLNGVFLSYYLNNAKKKEIARLAQGISVVHLYSSQLQRLNINVPGLPEQQKIADCLTSIDELVTAQTQKLDALKAHKKGLMQQLFPAMDDDCVDAGSRAAQDAKAEVSA